MNSRKLEGETQHSTTEGIALNRAVELQISPSSPRLDKFNYKWMLYTVCDMILFLGYFKADLMHRNWK